MNINYYDYQGKKVTTFDISEMCNMSVKWVRKSLYKYNTIEELIAVGKNYKRKNRYMYNGVAHNVKELLPYSKVPYNVLRQRLALGWPLERALNERVNK